MKIDVFISNAREDLAIATALCTALESQRIRCWYAARDAEAGVDWTQQIMHAIGQARLMVLVLSSHSNASREVQREVHHAVHNRVIPVVPFRIEDIQPGESIAFSLDNVHWLDALPPPAERHIGKLCDTVKRLLEDDEEAVGSPPPPATSRPEPRGSFRLAMGAAILAAIVVATGFLLFVRHAPPKPTVPMATEAPERIVIGGKQFLESSLLVEMMALVIEADHPDLEVVRKHYLGGPKDLVLALQLKEVHLYPEYTGTILTEQLSLPMKDLCKKPEHDPKRINERLEAIRSGVSTRVLGRFGFDNPYVLVMRGSRARELGIVGEDGKVEFSDWVKAMHARGYPLTIGSTQNFAERTDGAPLLEDSFDIDLRKVNYDHDDVYAHLAAAEVELAAGYGTDPEIRDPRRDFIQVEVKMDKELEGDKDEKCESFIDYWALPIIREDAVPERVVASLAKTKGKVGQTDIDKLLREAQHLSGPGLRQAGVQAQLRSIVRGFLERNSILPRSETLERPAMAQATADQGAPPVLQFPPYGDTQVGGTLIYRWSFDTPVRTNLRFNVKRQTETGQTFTDTASTQSFAESERIEGRIRWWVQAVRDAQAVAAESPKWEVSYYKDTYSRIEKTGTLVIAASDEAIQWIDANRNTGYEIEFLREALRSAFPNHETIQTPHQVIPWGPKFFHVLADRESRFDVMVGGISVDRPGREKGADEWRNVTFTRWIREYHQAFVHRRNEQSPLCFKAGERAASCCIIVKDETTNLDLARRIEREFPDAGVEVRAVSDASTYGDIAETLLGQEGDRCDLALMDAPYAYGAIDVPTRAESLRVKLVDESVIDDPPIERIGIGTKEADRRLRDVLNAAISETSPKIDKLMSTMGYGPR